MLIQPCDLSMRDGALFTLVGRDAIIEMPSTTLKTIKNLFLGCTPFLK